MDYFQFGKISDHVFKHQKQFIESGANDKELCLFLTELASDAKTVGLTGGRYTTVTYGFLGSVISN